MRTTIVGVDKSNIVYPPIGQKMYLYTIAIKNLIWNLVNDTTDEVVNASN